MHIDDIESRRCAVGIQQKALCQKAGVDQSTYSQLKLQRRGAYARTLDKLDKALLALEGQCGEADHA